MRQRRLWARALPSPTAEVACRAVLCGLPGEGLQIGPRDEDCKGMPCLTQPGAGNTACLKLSQGL